MIQYYAEFEVPDNADYLTIEDAKLSAKWKIRKYKTIDERTAETDLSNKCGSCKYFKPREGKYKYRGDCEMGRVGFRMRTLPRCSAYEKKKGRPREQ